MAKDDEYEAITITTMRIDFKGTITGASYLHPNAIVPEREHSVRSVVPRKLVWKLDLHLLPPLFALWFCSTLCRGSFLDASLYGLETDLGLDATSTLYTVALIVPFIGMALFAIPSNLVMKKIRPAFWLGIGTFLLGVFTLAQGVVSNSAGLIAVRSLAGICEATLLPGTLYLLTAYYPRPDLHWRLSVLMVGSAFASAFGGVIVSGIANTQSSSGSHGWKWVFIVDGAITAGVTILAFWFIADWPSRAKWLSEEEKAILVEDAASQGIIFKMDKLDGRTVERIFKDMKTFLCSLMSLCTLTALSSLPIFAPTVITQFQPTATSTSTLTIPIFLAGAFISLATGYASDKTRHRTSFALAGWVLAAVGLILLFTTSLPPVACYAALYLVSIGCYIAIPAIWTLLMTNCCGDYKILFAAGYVSAVGNISGIIPPLIFKPQDAPGFQGGYQACLAFICIAVFLGYCHVMWIRRENRARNTHKRDNLLHLSAGPDNLGDLHPAFRYRH